MQCPFDPKKKEKIVMHLIFLENKRGLQLLMLRSMITADDRYSGKSGQGLLFHYCGGFHYSARLL